MTVRLLEEQMCGMLTSQDCETIGEEMCGMLTSQDCETIGGANVRYASLTGL